MTECPVCGAGMIPFGDLDSQLRSELEAAPDRQRQSVSHRRTKHTVCPECTFEIHGCGQPYILPERVVER